MASSEARTNAGIFLAIAWWDKNQVTRDEVCHAAEAIDFAVPEEGEIDLAISFLTRHHLVESQGDALSITDAGRAVIEAAHEGAENVFAELKALEYALGSIGAG